MSENKILRSLDEKTFMPKLKNGGEWHFLVEQVKKDHTLHFQIRDNYINVYYRGCSILWLNEKGEIEIATEYLTLCDKADLKQKNTSRHCGNISSFKWCKHLPLIKQSIDEYLATNEKLEREFQQVIARSNTFSKIANDTDYFIVDTEMTEKDNSSRFDMIAIKWNSTKHERRVDKNCRLAVIEVKYGQDAFDNLSKHYKDIKNYDKFEELKQSAITQFQQLRELGLVQFSKDGNKNEVQKLEGEIEFILILANYKPSSQKIDSSKAQTTHLDFIRQMDTELKEKGIILKFATSNFMGYGLYSNAMLDFKEFEELYKTRNKK